MEDTGNTPIRDWISLTKAAGIFKVSGTKLSNMVKEGRIVCRDNPRDRRMTMLDLNELRRMFPPLNEE